MITIRKMEEKDVKCAGKLEKENFSTPWPEHAFLEMLNCDYAIYCVAEECGTIVGICGLRNLAGEGEITNVVVDEAYRRNGIAKMLLTRILEEGKEQGILAFTLEVRTSNKSAIGLYEKFGFKSEGIRKNFYEKPNEDALIMWKR